MARFLIIAFGITWLGVAPLALASAGLGPPLPPWLHGIGALGPVAAAAVSRRDHGVYASRGPSHLSAGWHVLCLLTPLAMAALALSVAVARGEAVAEPLSGSVSDPAWLVSLFVGSVAYGFGEEPGWRGWLLPRLQSRFTPVRATVVLTVIWGAWHTPFFFYRFEFDGVATVVGFFVGLLAGAFWLTFLFNSSGGSVWTVVWWHVLWNLANLTLAAASDVAVAVLNASMMILGFTVLAAFGRRGLAVAGAAPVRAVPERR